MSLLNERHAAVAAAALNDDAVTRKVLDDYKTAPIDEKLRATLGPAEDDARARRADADRRARRPRAGVSRAALTEAMHVAYLFNIYDRLADTMGWHVPALEGGFYQVAAKRLLKHGYQ